MAPLGCSEASHISAVLRLSALKLLIKGLLDSKLSRLGLGRAPSLCCQGVNLVQEDDGASKLLSRPEDFGEIAFRLAIPLACHSLQRHIDQGHCCLARDNPAQDGRLQAMRICVNRPASDAGKAAQPPQRSLPGSAQTRHTTFMPQFPAARRSGVMLPGSKSPCSETNDSTLGHGMGFPTRNYSTPAALCFLAAAGGSDVLLIKAASHTQRKHLAAAQQATKHEDFDAVTGNLSHVLGRNCSGSVKATGARQVGINAAHHRALVVFPQPGGPSNRTARGRVCSAANFRVPLATSSYTSGCSSASSTVSSICRFWSSYPAPAHMLPQQLSVPKTERCQAPETGSATAAGCAGAIAGDWQRHPGGSLAALIDYA